MPNVAIMADYASLGAPPDPEEVKESGRLARVHISSSDDRQKRLSFPQSVRDVVLGSGEIVCLPCPCKSIFTFLSFVLFSIVLLFQLGLISFHFMCMVRW